MNLKNTLKHYCIVVESQHSFAQGAGTTVSNEIEVTSSIRD